MLPTVDTQAPTRPSPIAAVAPRAPDQAGVFRQLRYRLFRNGLRVALETGKLKLFTMLATSAIVGIFVFALSLYALDELFRFKVPIKGLIVSGLFDLMFFTLGVMLVFSTGIILYASLFTSPESRYLLTTPATADRIFATKFQAAVGFSSWAFLILGMPILIAYGIVAGVPWYFYPLLPIYLLGFVLVPGSVSAIICLLFVRYLPRNRKQALLALGLFLVLLGGVWAVRTAQAARRTFMTQKKDEVEGLIGQFALVQHPLNPSHWMTTGIMAAARGEATHALTRLALIWSHGLIVYLIAAWSARRIYRNAYDRVAGGGFGRRIYRQNLLDRIMELLVFYLNRSTRVLVVKDFRTFRRDPTQWVLLAIIGGLMLLGAMNTRQYYRNDLVVIDRYALSLINVFATSVLMCAGLSRFIFPLISLEGRKFWILGLLPIRREQILLGKFAFAATGSVIVAESLILISDALLMLPPLVLVVHALTLAAVAIGLSGLNVGLGAYLANFQETDPSKIVVGFGGTVNMVMGLLYLMLVVGVMVVPTHIAGLARGFSGGEHTFPMWSLIGVPVGLLLALIAVLLPLRAGARSLRSREF